MRTIGDTITRLNAASSATMFGQANASGRLTPLPATDFNPGALSGHAFVPAGTAPMPLVVVLHGCTQTAAGYDAASGWSDLAERFGFAVLFPEQQRSNNANLCFNWFAAEDIRRGGGEAASIRGMIAHMVDTHPIDPARIYVTGLSAGGAMTSTMLATYPEVFAGGAIIAGLPHGAATTMPQAFDRMRGHGLADDEVATATVRAASDHTGPWPTVSVWHGTADATVSVRNAEAIVGQWRALHGLPVAPMRTDTVDGHPHRVWLDAQGRTVLEDYSIVGMGHGTPLRRDGDTATGTPAAHMLDAGISSTWHIAQGWNLLAHERARTEPAAVPSPAAAPRNDVQSVIESALRTAGLMR